MYGLPKVHKTGCPVRPILSLIGTFNYKLAKFFVPLLKPFTSNSNTAHDSFSFVKELSFLPNHNYFMASFDVISLFTNSPLNESIDLCTDLVFENRQSFEYEECNFDRNNFSKLLSFAVKNNHFLFNGKLYDKIDGVAMGSPPRPYFG